MSPSYKTTFIKLYFVNPTLLVQLSSSKLNIVLFEYHICKSCSQKNTLIKFWMMTLFQQNITSGALNETSQWLVS